MKNNQKGFSAIELLLILVIVALIGGLGWFVYQQNKSSTPNPAQADNSVSTESTQNEKTAQKFLEIKEWDIKIKMRDANKLTYRIDNTAGHSVDRDYEGSLVLVMKPEFLERKSCETGTIMYRSSKNQSGTTRIGDYYYFGHGAPGACGDRENHPDDLLKIRVNEDFTVGNIEVL